MSLSLTFWVAQDGKKEGSENRSERGVDCTRKMEVVRKILPPEAALCFSSSTSSLTVLPA